MIEKKKSALALSLLLLATTGCKMLNLDRSSQVNSNNSNSSKVSSDYEAILPPQIGSFTRSAKPNSMVGCDEIYGISDYPKCDSSASADYKAANGEKVIMGITRFKSAEDAKSALEKHIAQDTDYSASKEPGFDPGSDLLRFKIVKRIPTSKGGELLILDSMPRYRKAEEAYWVKENDFYMWVDVSGTKNLSEVETLANTYVQR